MLHLHRVFSKLHQPGIGQSTLGFSGRSGLDPNVGVGYSRRKMTSHTQPETTPIFLTELHRLVKLSKTTELYDPVANKSLGLFNPLKALAMLLENRQLRVIQGRKQSTRINMNPLVQGGPEGNGFRLTRIYDHVMKTPAGNPAGLIRQLRTLLNVNHKALARQFHSAASTEAQLDKANEVLAKFEGDRTILPGQETSALADLVTTLETIYKHRRAYNPSLIGQPHPYVAIRHRKPPVKPAQKGIIKALTPEKATLHEDAPQITVEAPIKSVVSTTRISTMRAMTRKKVGIKQNGTAEGTKRRVVKNLVGKKPTKKIRVKAK